MNNPRATARGPDPAPPSRGPVVPGSPLYGLIDLLAREVAAVLRARQGSAPSKSAASPVRASDPPHPRRR